VSIVYVYVNENLNGNENCLELQRKDVRGLNSTESCIPLISPKDLRILLTLTLGLSMLLSKNMHEVLELVDMSILVSRPLLKLV